MTSRQKQINFDSAKDVDVDQRVFEGRNSLVQPGRYELSFGSAAKRHNHCFRDPFGASAWVHSVCIEACLPSGERKLYFLKVSLLQVPK